MRAIVNTSPDAVIVIDQDGHIVEFNPAAETCLGYSRDFAIGMPIDELIIPARPSEAHKVGLSRYLPAGNAQPPGKRVEVDALRADGTKFPIELAISVLRGAEGDEFVAHVRDISECKKAKVTGREQNLPLDATVSNKLLAAR